MMRVGEPVLLLAQALGRGVVAAVGARRQRRRDARLVGDRRGPQARGVAGERRAADGLGRRREFLLQGGFAVADHVHVHKGRAGDVEAEDGGDDRADEANLLEADQPRLGRQHLAGDARRVEEVKRRVAEPEDWVGHGAQQRAKVKRVTDRLHRGPREHHEADAHLPGNAAGLLGARVEEGHADDPEARRDLHRRDEERRPDEARSRVENLQRHGPLHREDDGARGGPDVAEVARGGHGLDAAQ
mmetsp:Transcript_6807/g.22008  ORF Transcript_6807/g.22008 Transcript_6807/m.22008 type:complete len:244 (-) Transcript_6807:102-833(-)